MNTLYFKHYMHIQYINYNHRLLIFFPFSLGIKISTCNPAIINNKLIMYSYM